MRISVGRLCCVNFLNRENIFTLNDQHSESWFLPETEYRKKWQQAHCFTFYYFLISMKFITLTMVRLVQKLSTS